jgi:hypothetical protein
MREIMEYAREKLDWAADRILELFTGLRGYRVQEMQVRAPDVRKVVGARYAQRFPSYGPLCDRY